MSPEDFKAENQNPNETPEEKKAREEEERVAEANKEEEA